MVVVPDALSGRFRSAHAAPAESARAMITPPWSTPPAVQRDGAHAIDSTTFSAVYESALVPRVVASGLRPRSRSVGSVTPSSLPRAVDRAIKLGAGLRASR